MRLLSVIVLSALMGCSTAPRVVAVPMEPPQAATAPATYTVTGTATVSMQPDVAELSVVLSAERDKPKQAAASVRQSQEALISALQAAGLSPSDIAISRLVLTPVQEPVDKYGVKTRLRGYDASVTVTICTRDFERLPELMEVAASSGATHLSSTFRVDDLPERKQQAREEAAKAARRKAQAMASALGIELGRVRGITESDGGGWQMRYDNAQLSNAYMVETPADIGGVRAESQEITMSVSVTYEL